MKMYLSPSSLFVAALVLLAAANIFVLAGVAYNRSGDPGTVITLTERELAPPYYWQKDNSGLSLELNWRSLSRDDDRLYPDWRTPYWLGAEKLAALGFDVAKYQHEDADQYAYKEPLAKEVFLVLENGGEPYGHALQRAEANFRKKEAAYEAKPGDKAVRSEYETTQGQWQRERMTASRLFVIDAGRDPRALRRQYADKTRFIISRGQVRMLVRYRDTVRKGSGRRKRGLYGTISRLSSENIHVPLKHRAVFDAIIGHDDQDDDGYRPPRYEVDLAYGKRYEPWIVAVRKIAETDVKREE